MQALNTVGKRYQVIVTLEPFRNGQAPSCHGSRSEADGAVPLSVGLFNARSKCFSQAIRRRGSFAGKLPSESSSRPRGPDRTFLRTLWTAFRTEMGNGWGDKRRIQGAG
jgi:hypothetical protein